MADPIAPTVAEADSILDTVKKAVGLAPDYTAFDLELTMHVNSTFLTLHQLGVGPTAGFSIADRTTTWSEFLGDDPLLNGIKTYISMKVKILFDAASIPPGALTAIQENLKETEWRLNVHVDKGVPSVVPDPADP